MLVVVSGWLGVCSLLSEQSRRVWCCHRGHLNCGGVGASIGLRGIVQGVVGLCPSAVGRAGLSRWEVSLG